MVSAMLGYYPGAQTQEQITMEFREGWQVYLVVLTRGWKRSASEQGQRKGQGLAS